MKMEVNPFYSDYMNEKVNVLKPDNHIRKNK